MNENSKHKQQTVSNLLQTGKLQLDSAGIDSSRIDSEILLAHTLEVDKVWLRTHDQDLVTREDQVAFLYLIERRQDFEPVAYLIGSKEFYGRSFTVTKDTLIPRPESEEIISLLKYTSINRVSHPKIIDIGTGSGVLGITAKLEIPNAEVLLTDTSHRALSIARLNAEKQSAEVDFIRSDLLDRVRLSDNSYVIANLPYVDETWDFLSKDIRHEPANALYADNAGLGIIFKLLHQIASHSAKNITLLIESDTSQQDAIVKKMKELNLKPINKSDFVVVALKN